MFESTLGSRWLGMDVGEQDGRYVGGYAAQMVPASASRFEQYLNFHRHFESMCDELGNKMCVLGSLNFGHYLLKEGIYSAIGAETRRHCRTVRSITRLFVGRANSMVCRGSGMPRCGIDGAGRPMTRRGNGTGQRRDQPQLAEATALQPHPVQLRVRGL